ncbi:MAG: PAS domain S-box protein, partial [Ignavibacteria bacterium]|nr:PAS domain S-box protein [Ignavibacteria bacterium]
TIEKLNNLNAELEQKIKEKTKELEDTIEKLSEINSLLKKENQERKELYENLRKSQENYKKFIDNIPVGVYRSNLSGKILLANPALAKILECDSVEELLNYSAYHFYKTKEIRNEVIKIHSSKEETLLKVETEMITKKGKKIFVNDYGKAVKDPETNETFFDGIIIDITDKHLIEKELAKRERQYRKLFESLNEILIQVNEDEIIEVVSPFITKVLGYPIEKIIGQSFRKLLLKPDWFDKIKTLLNENGEARNILNEFKDINGQIRILKGDYILFTEETGRKTYEIILQDVTEELELQNFMNAIFTVFKTFNQDKEIYEIVDNIIKAIQFITIVPNFILALKNSETNTLKIVRHNDRFGYRFSRLDLNNKSHPIIDSLYRQKTKIYTEEELEHFWDDNRLQPPSLMISLPLTIQRETLGVIVIYTYAQDQILSRANIYYLNTLAEQISLGLERKLLSEKLNAQLKLFEVLIESIPYPIYYRSFRTQRYRYCNTAFELYVEKPKQEIIGRRPDEIFPEAISKFIMEKDEEIRKSLITQTYQIEHIDSQGNKKTYISIRSPIVLKEIDDEAVVGILIDITERLNYETELRNALEYNKLILELVPSAIFTINKDIMITSWNKEAEMITGFSPEDVIGKKCFFCENIIKYNVCNLIQNPELNSFNENEMLFTTKDGTKILVSKKASILKDELGNITGGIIAFENITLKREIEKRLSYLADTNSRLTTISSLAVNIDDANILVDTILPIALQITESEGVCYIEFSKISDIYTITRIIDYKFSGKESRSVNIPFEKFINTYCGKIFVDREILIIEYADKQKLLPEISFIEKKRFIEVPLQSGEELYGVLFAYGKEFPYTEEEASALDRLALIFATNMDRIKYQNEMQNLLIKQFQINELRSNFINLISHEYRTPLQAIVLSAEILRRHFDKLNPEQRDKQFQRIEKAIKDMSDMLENVILYNKMTQPSEEINLEEVDTKLFFESLIRDFTLYYQDSAKINYNINTNLQQVKVDPKLLHLIFSNLVSNGIKYSQPNPILDIEVNVNEDGIFLKFTDNGIGIDENEIPNIFEPFYRGKNTKTISGTGLGLSIVSNAVNLLGGKINLKSELGKGTTFEIFLPHN